MTGTDRAGAGNPAGTPKHLDGSVAVVTGSSRGVGLAVAAALAREGAAVVVNGRDRAVAERAAEQIAAEGGRVRAVAGSAAEPDVVDRLLGTAHEHFGEVDVLVNCAGTAEPTGSSILDVTTEQWRELLDAHLTSTFATCRALAPRMAARGRGTIVNTSSHAFTGAFGGTGYPAGKGGVNSLTMALAAELRESGIRVNAVCPGARTRLSTGEEYEDHVEDLHRRGMLDDLMRAGALRPAPAEYVAELYAFLASDLAAGITGQIYAGAGCYVGRFAEPEAELIAWRDHEQHPPWSPAEIARQVGAASAAVPTEGERS